MIKYYIYTAVFLIMIFVLLTSLKSKNFTETDFVNGAKRLIKDGTFSKQTLQLSEKIYRLETANFKSSQYKQSGSAGMQAVENTTVNTFYGWGFKSFLKKTELKPIGLLTLKDNTGVSKKFIKFKSVYGALYVLCFVLSQYGNNAGKYFSTNPQMILYYNEKIKKINSPIINSLI